MAFDRIGANFSRVYWPLHFFAPKRSHVFESDTSVPIGRLRSLHPVTLAHAGWRAMLPVAHTPAESRPILTRLAQIAPILYSESVFTMKTKLIALSLALSMASVSGVASAGCLKGALVGGVAGHVAGKHGLAGAAAGCAVGHHLSKKKQREQAAQQQAAAQAQANAQAQAAAAKKK